MASLSRGISFRRQGSSGVSWTDSWSFNEEGELVRKLKDDGRIHNSAAMDHQAQISAAEEQPPVVAITNLSSSSSSVLERSKSVGARPPQKPSSSPSIFKWLKKALCKMKR